MVTSPKGNVFVAYPVHVVSLNVTTSFSWFLTDQKKKFAWLLPVRTTNDEQNKHEQKNVN